MDWLVGQLTERLGERTVEQGKAQGGLKSISALQTLLWLSRAYLATTRTEREHSLTAHGSTQLHRFSLRSMETSIQHIRFTTLSERWRTVVSLSLC